MTPTSISTLLRVAHRRCVVVGAGVTGLRRARSLQQAGGQVTLIDPAGADIENVEVLAQPYRREQLDGAWLTCACTDDGSLNGQIAADARQAGCCLVYRSDAPEASDVTFQPTRQQGPVTLSLSTGGASPALAKRLIEQVSLPDKLGPFVEALGQLREEVIAATDDPDCRRRVLRTLAEPGMYELFCSQGSDALSAACRNLLRPGADGP